MLTRLILAFVPIAVGLTCAYLYDLYERKAH